jgi:hypothetical protein
MLDERHALILSELAKYTGQRVPSRFIKQTPEFIPQIERFHNLVTGIFKPAWSEYALSIRISLKSPYEHKDEVIFLGDGRWLMTYSPRAGGMSKSDNRALIRCLDDGVPVGVFKQLTDKRDKQHGASYQVLGLGIITDYDASSEVFVVESANHTALEKVTDVIKEEDVRYEVQLYANLTNEFRPFIREETVTYSVSKTKRIEGFRRIILQEYVHTCAICGTKFHLDNLVEATAAHIVPKKDNGTDDPRNGLSLCRTHHWAFDKGIFTLSDDYTILLSQAVYQAETSNFHLVNMSGHSILLPIHDAVKPHPDAIQWHRDNIWKG